MKKRILVLLLMVITLFHASGQKIGTLSQISVSANGHYLVTDDGSPFFWLGDTAWELFHRLTMEEINTYLENRSSKGFNVIQASVLAEMDGLQKPNRYGYVPFYDLDPTKPNDNYFQLVDTVVKMALQKDLYMGLLPTWGDKVTLLWGAGPVIFNPDNAYKYGLWIGNRYANYPNIIWILGGDRPPMKDSTDWRPVWNAMAKGILEGTNNKALITYHPWGGDLSTSQYIHDAEWLDLNMIQSGHGGGRDVPIWNLIARDWNIKPSKPVLDAEPNYEDHPVNPWPTWDPKNGYYRDYDVRKQTYRSVFAGACGVTYGHHSVWQFWSEKEDKINFADRYWTEAMDRPGAFQIGYLKKLIESRPQLTRIPDQTIIEKGQGEKGEYVCATRDSMGSFMMIYLPVRKTITVNTTSIVSDKISAYWFNPRTSEITNSFLFPNIKHFEFTSPTLGVENDWVLILDNPAYKHNNPFPKSK